MPAAKFRAAVRAAEIGEMHDVPHLGKPLIDKYLADLRLLGMLTG
jgi:fatty acid CoA ligase FadD9